MQLRKHEACWPGDVLDEVEIADWSAEIRGRIPLGSSCCVAHRTLAALNLGGPVFTSEIDGDVFGSSSRPGDAAFIRNDDPASDA
jgi:hypothetical protein